MSNLHHLYRNNATALRKTASYYVIHVVVAALVAYAVTGSWVAALTMSFLEPSVQALAYFVHEKVWARSAWVRARTVVKTITYYVMHLAVAAGVAFAVTGNLWMALTLSLLEPTVQMFFFYLHEKAWDRKAQRTVRTTIMMVCESAAGCARAPTCTQRCAMHAAA